MNQKRFQPLRFSMRFVAATALLFCIALVPAFSQSETIPEEITLGTLYSGALEGDTIHRLDIPERGFYGIFFSGSAVTGVRITLPSGETRDESYSPESGNFALFDIPRSGQVDFEFALADPEGYTEYHHYAFVVAPVEVIDLVDTYRGRVEPVALWSDPSEAMGLTFLAFEGRGEELVTAIAEGVGPGFSLMIGSDTGVSAFSDSYVEGYPEDAAVAEIPTDRGVLYGMLIVEEIGYEESETGEFLLRFDRSELVRLEPQDLYRDEEATGFLNADAEHIGGRRGIPYIYSGQSGEDVSFLLESADFDTFLYVEFPDGTVMTDDDGAWSANSLLELTLPARGEYRIYVASFGGREEGAYTLLATDPEAARDIVSEYGGMGVDPWAEDLREDEIVDVWDIGIGDIEIVRITEDGSVFRGGSAAVFDLTIRSPENVAVDVRSEDFDTTITLITESGEEFYDDDGGNETNSLLRVADLQSGTHRIYVAPFDGYDFGEFEIVVDTYVPGPQAADVDGVFLDPGSYVEWAIETESPTYEERLVEVFVFEVKEGAGPIVTMRSLDFDTYLYVITPEGYVVTDDDGAGGTDSQVVIGDATGGAYRVYAGSYPGTSTGAFSIELVVEDK